MIAGLIKTGLKFVGVGGAGISSGWLIVGAVVAIGVVLGGVWKSGYDYANTLCEAANLREENARLKTVMDEKDRQLDVVNTIQQADSERAERLAKQLKEKEDASPQITCDPPASAPVGVRGQPASKGIRNPNAKHSGSTERHRAVRRGPNKPPGEADSGGSKSPVELRPGFAR